VNILIKLLRRLRLLNNMKLKYFKKSEFTCKCGCGETVISDDLLQMLDNAREHAGIPFKITSGYRCPNHTESKKNPTSSHIKGLAADIKCSDSKTRAILIDALTYVEFCRIGISKSFIHVDIDEDKVSPVIWLY
tara:strand:+ start:792 stop:1193 length:402 start_codon:yes stop_codon:yes gene_type:complete